MLLISLIACIKQLFFCFRFHMCVFPLFIVDLCVLILLFIIYFISFNYVIYFIDYVY